MSAGTVAVVGSANVDLVLTVDRLVRPGETVLARSVSRHPGGKGANQAVAAARDGAPTLLLGAVGADEHGRLLTDALHDAGVDVTLVRVVDAPTGLAVISVDASGENAIVVAAGANAARVALDDEERDAVTAAAVVLAQLEIPVDRVVDAFDAARAAGTRTVLNAAPVRDLPDRLWERLDLLVVNEHEAAVLAGGVDDPPRAAAVLLERVPDVVVTLGAAGFLAARRGLAHETCPGRPARAVDTTGAGDTFCGVLAAGLARGQPVAVAGERANVAAALSVERAGAIPSIPDAAQISRAVQAS